MPERIQRKRTKGYKMPPNTISVTRPGKWGNPYVVVHYVDKLFNVFYKKGDFRLMIAWAVPEDMALKLSIEKYEEEINHDLVKKELKGKNLACFCSLEKKCHADVLLRICNE